MKSYTHNINGVDYTLRITGTIGLHIIAESLVPEADREIAITEGDRTKSIPSPKWLMALLYAALCSSNDNVMDKVDFFAFMTSFSAKEFNEAVTWYYTAYAEREGLLPANIPTNEVSGSSPSASNEEQKKS